MLGPAGAAHIKLSRGFAITSAKALSLVIYNCRTNLKQVRQQLAAKNLSETQRHQYQQVGQELEAALLTDFVRKTHGHRSANFVRTRYATDKRWAVAQTNLAEYVAKICQSHTEPARNLTPANGFNYDESIGPCQVNMPYLGLVLRLADILDFDRERTPDELYKSIHFSSSISLAEWEKHRSVEGWTIAPKRPRHGWFTRPSNDDDQCASQARRMVRKSSYILSRCLS